MQSFSSYEIDVLIRAGDWIDKSDHLNVIDKKRWSLYRGHGLMMSRMLVKYRGVLVDAFPEIDEILEKAPEATTVEVQRRQTSYGPAVYFKASFIPKDKFQTYKNTLKSSGLWFDGETKSWFVPTKDLSGFNFNALFERLVNMNFEVSEVEDTESQPDSDFGPEYE